MLVMVAGKLYASFGPRLHVNSFNPFLYHVQFLEKNNVCKTSKVSRGFLLLRQERCQSFDKMFADTWYDLQNFFFHETGRRRDVLNQLSSFKCRMEE